MKIWYNLIIRNKLSDAQTNGNTLIRLKYNFNENKINIKKQIYSLKQWLRINKIRIEFGS